MKKRTKITIGIIAALLIGVGVMLGVLHANNGGVETSKQIDNGKTIKSSSTIADAELGGSAWTPRSGKASGGSGSGGSGSKDEPKSSTYKITFIDEKYPNAGEEVTKKVFVLPVGQGLSDKDYPVRSDPGGDDNIVFVGYDFQRDGYDYPFMTDFPYNRDITVYAYYAEYSKIVEHIEYNYENPVGSDYSILIKANDGKDDHNVEELRNKAFFYELENSFQAVDDEDVNYENLGNGEYRLSLKNYEPGKHYSFFLMGDYHLISSFDSRNGEITLGFQYSFISWEVYKDENDVVYRDDIVWLSYDDDGDIAESDFTVSQKTAQDLGTGDENSSEGTGSYVSEFKYSGDKNINVGQTVCFYTGIAPNERQYADADTTQYANEKEVYYAIVTSKTGNTYKTRNIEQEEISHIFYIPKTIPFKVGRLPSKDGTVQTMAYDSSVWQQMGQSGVPDVQKDDYLVFYKEFSEETEENGDYVFAVVKSVNNYTIDYEIVDYDKALDALEEVEDFKVVQDLPEDYLYEQLGGDEGAAKIEQEIEEELNTEGSEYQQQVMEMVEASLDVPELVGEENQNLLGEGSRVEIEAKEFKATVNYGAIYITDGGVAKLSVKIGALLIIEIKANDNKTIHYVVTTNLLQEFCIDPSASGEFNIGWALFIPYINECWFSLRLDLRTATDFNIDVRHYTVDTDDTDWEKLKNFYTSDEFVLNGLEYFKNESEYELKKNSTDPTEVAEADAAYLRMQKIFLLHLMVPYIKNWTLEVKNPVNAIRGLARARELNKEFALSSTIVDLLGTPEEGLDDTNISAFQKKYKAMVNSSAEWITLFEKPLGNIPNIPVIPGAIEIEISPTFYTELMVNISLNANFHVEYGKGYEIKVDIADWDISTYTYDVGRHFISTKIIAMGKLGVRCGVRIAFDFKFIKVFKVGVSAGAGPYFEVEGYVIFEYYRDYRNAYTSYTKAKGALYSEMGFEIQLRFSLKVLFFGSKSWNIWNPKWEFFHIGEKENVYKFDYAQLGIEEMLQDDNLAIVNKSTDMKLPSRWRMMGYIDMGNGSLNKYAAEANHYNYTFYTECPLEEDSDGKLKYKENAATTDIIAVDKDGRMSRTDGKTDPIELWCVITWKEPNLAFSNYTIRRTVRVLFSYDEKTIKKSISVKTVDKETGDEKVVWVKEYIRGRQYTIPTKTELLNTIDSEGIKYVENESNYKDADSSGVPPYATGQVLKDETFSFLVTRKKYSLDLKYLSRDNETLTKTYYARYGDKFDIDDTFLKDSTVKVSDTSYLKYSHIDGVEIRDSGKTKWNRDWTQAIDSNYVKELLDGKHYLEAQYVANNVNITYEFNGVKLNPVKTVIESGTVPPELSTLWNTDEAGVLRKLKEAAGIPKDDTKTRLTYTITPERKAVIHDSKYMVNVVTEKLQAPYVIESYKGNVKLGSVNTVGESEKLYYGVSTSATATEDNISWFEEPFIPNLEKKTTYYFYCKKLYDTSVDKLYSGASDPWSWDEEDPEPTTWRNGIHITSNTANVGTTTLELEIVFFDGKKTEVKTVTVAPGDDIYTDCFKDIHDPWMINKIRVKAVDNNWVGAVNTYSYDSKYSIDFQANRTESSSSTANIKAGKARAITVNGPKRRITDVGNFDAGTDITISMSDSSSIVKEGDTEYWVYKYNGNAKDQFSTILDEKGNIVGYDYYNVFERDDPPYVEAELISVNPLESKDIDPMSFIEPGLRTLKIDTEKMKAYLGTKVEEGKTIEGSMKIKVKLIFPERSTYIGPDGDKELTNVFVREITIKP